MSNAYFSEYCEALLTDDDYRANKDTFKSTADLVDRLLCKNCIHRLYRESGGKCKSYKWIQKDKKINGLKVEETELKFQPINNTEMTNDSNSKPRKARVGQKRRGRPKRDQ